MASNPSLADNYAAVKAKVADAAQKAGRSADEVVIVAVTKYAGLDDLKHIIDLGHRDLGENRVPQLVDRAGELNAPDGQPIRWHMIGHLQRNKVKQVLPVTRLIHSVDTLRLAEEIHTQGAKRDRATEVLLQVNVAQESKKHGVSTAAAYHVAEQISTMLWVNLRGLMCMAPYDDDPEASRPHFARCGELFREIQSAGFASDQFNILSMGMSNDFQVGIEEGANVVRVGRALFGETEH